MFAVMPNGANDRWSDDLAHRATSARGQRLSMKIVIDDLRHRLGHARRALQVLQLSVLDRSGRTEMHQQRLLPCGADTRHFVQRACSHSLASLRTMGPNGETVRLVAQALQVRSEEHTSELQSLMRTSYAVFCLKTKIETKKYRQTQT